MIDEAAWKQTVDLSMTTKNQDGETVLTKQPEGLAFTNDYVQKALDQPKARGDRRQRRRVRAGDGDPQRGRRLAFAEPVPHHPGHGEVAALQQRLPAGQVGVGLGAPAGRP